MLHPSKAVIIILSLFCLGLYAENTFTPEKWFRWPANGPAVTVSAGSWMFGGNDGRDCLVSKMVAVVLFRKWLRLFDISNAWRQ